MDLHIVAPETDEIFTTKGQLPAAQVRLVRQTFNLACGNVSVRTDKFLEASGEHVGNDVEIRMNPANVHPA